jgi:hypothetical protein
MTEDGGWRTDVGGAVAAFETFGGGGGGLVPGFMKLYAPEQISAGISAPGGRAFRGRFRGTLLGKA